ncbi:hypothetical protein EDD16DRAFT_1474509 [Pisolithus croceorrhizus]|nr:hypothetical protein EV401DRAFT_1867917 [Pisolithus croceorrhizus]KAI6125022.1 hypothetical protein EDD16DRAFT_1474509 [Pisolithus croceorrhizus]KAI6161896.1 hypothetical protein EDD17DRAFT_1480215 [Pisolithus thermaeus]
MATDEEGHCGFLKAPLIQKTVNMMWFANKHDNRVMFHKHIRPFPYLALALILSAIECCIDEWMTSMWTDIPFTTQEYCGTYELHLKCLQAFEDAIKTYNFMPASCTRLYEVGWCVYTSPYISNVN